MAHGAPDWTVSAPSTSTFVSMDTSELAVRLGAVSIDDRKGNVIWYDDFSNGIGNLYFFNPDAYRQIYLSLFPVNYHKPSLAAWINYTSAYGAFIYKYLHLIPAGSVGFETSFIPHDNLDYIQFTFSRYTGAQRQRFGIRYTHSNQGRVEVEDNGTWVTLVYPGVMSNFRDQFHYFKVTFNYSTLKYKQWIKDNVIYDITNRSAAVTNDTNKYGYETLIQMASKLSGVCITYFSHFLTTINE